MPAAHPRANRVSISGPARRVEKKAVLYFLAMHSCVVAEPGDGAEEGS